MDKANRHDGVIWKSEIRQIFVCFKSACGKGNNVKLFSAPIQDKQINHARLNIISTTLHGPLEFVFLAFSTPAHSIKKLSSGCHQKTKREIKYIFD